VHAAFEEIVRRDWDVVMRFFWKRVARSDAEDLAQDVFVAVYEALRRGQGPHRDAGNEWRRYLLTAARNRWVDRLRRDRGEGMRLDDLLVDADQTLEVRPPADTASPADMVVSADQIVSVRDCMDTLECRQRAVCWSFFMDGEKKREIARRLGEAESTVRYLLTSALAVLRACLRGKGFTAENSA
jgi:RNA polymerase sigma factor (sigma-70 family)